ncbi:hypothetical protein [Halorhodospira halochloris]|uniref:hypothetical protein n=1 Tax=Halorhodospira halochloris TaxID=1052 RepID=UPI00076F9542|nr:hypothetical protein [Halorhodospira halochloris]
MNPSLEASWRHPWRQDLHTGADGGGAGEVFRGHHLLVKVTRLSQLCTTRKARDFDG